MRDVTVVTSLADSHVDRAATGAELVAEMAAESWQIFNPQPSRQNT